MPSTRIVLWHIGKLPMCSTLCMLVSGATLQAPDNPLSTAENKSQACTLLMPSVCWPQVLVCKLKEYLIAYQTQRTHETTYSELVEVGSQASTLLMRQVQNIPRHIFQLHETGMGGEPLVRNMPNDDGSALLVWHQSLPSIWFLHAVVMCHTLNRNAR